MTHSYLCMPALGPAHQRQLRQLPASPSPPCSISTAAARSLYHITKHNNACKQAQVCPVAYGKPLLK